MFDPQVIVSPIGRTYQLYKCDFIGCSRTSAVPANSDIKPRGWEFKDGKHFCNMKKCMHDRKMGNSAIVIPIENINKDAKKGNESKIEESEELELVGNTNHSVSRIYKHTCFRCGSGSDTGDGWWIVKGGLKLCNRRACRDFAFTHSEHHMMHRTEVQVDMRVPWLFAMLFAVMSMACSPMGVNPTQVTTPPAAISVSPPAIELEAGTTQQFTSSAAGTTWAVAEPNGGTITSAGLYTAPTVDGTYTVLSTSSTGTTGKSTVKVRNTKVTVSPSTVQLSVGGTVQLTGSVTGPTDKSLAWSVQETNGGTVTAAGLYTAPAAAGTFHVIATSVANPSKSAAVTASITSTPTSQITIAVSPASATVKSCTGTMQFGAILTGTSDNGVTWRVQETGGGTITSSGLYTPPAGVTTGVYHVIATSFADTTKTAVGTVTLQEGVTVDVYPKVVSLPPGGTQQFTATVTTSCGATSVATLRMAMSYTGQLVALK